MRWSAACSSVAAYLPATDLRFNADGDEASFAAFYRSQLPRSLAIASTFASVGFFGLVLVPAFAQQRRREGPLSFEWEERDPSMPLFAAGCTISLIILIIAVCVVFATQRPNNMVAISEHSAVCIAIVFVCSAVLSSEWCVAAVYISGPGELWGNRATAGAEGLAAFTQACAVTLFTSLLPVRAHLLRLVPVCAAVTHVLLLSFHPSRTWTSFSITSMLALLCCMQLLVALRHERRARELWLAVRGHGDPRLDLEVCVETLRALQSIRGGLGADVFVLDASLAVSHELLGHRCFGQSVCGRAFPGLLADDDRASFARAVREASASHTAQSMLATSSSECGECVLRLSVADAGCREPRYLVQVRSIATGTAAELGPSRRDPICPEIMSDSGLFDFMLEPRSLPQSVASTTKTGRVFTGLDRGLSEESDLPLSAMLQSVADVGAQEHWLIDPADLRLTPERVLGRGGFGVVIMGRLRGTAVAAKLPRRSAQGKNNLSSVLNELRVHRHVRHTNIALFFGACVDHATGNLALIYELIHGPRLKEYVTRTVKPEDTLIQTKLLLDVAGALAYLHRLCPIVVHGDVKPENVLVERLATCPRAKLLDFGLSMLVTKRARLRGGTKRWMAPELISEAGGAPKLLPSADVYSFGLLAYFVVLRKPPFGSIDIAALQVPAASRPTCLPLAWAGESPLLQPCRRLCEACLGFEPGLRADMPAIQEAVLEWLPADIAELQKVGIDVLALLVESCGWDEALARLEQSLPEPACCARQAETPSSREGPGAVEDATACTPEDSLQSPMSAVLEVGAVAPAKRVAQL
mmetsp:Transcript_47688/g.138949  ORF Transcript_47688/g.138949 Transcript_47688/m.138949 type:complete len:812 (-) Transcript_47688:218-2653(-)